MRSFVAVLLLGAASAGCYLAHSPGGGAAPGDGGRADAPDASSTCLPEATYDVPFRLLTEEPPGCLRVPMVSTVPMHIPPIAEEFIGMCSSSTGAVEQNGPCGWRVRSECLDIDDSTQITGLVSADGVVRGRFLIERSTLMGVCRGELELGP